MYSYNDEVEFGDLLGKTLKSISVAKDKSAIDFETEDGEKYSMFHSQDCCECVEIEEIVGELDNLIGSPILQAEVSTNEDIIDGKPEYPDSWTWTFYKLATVKGYVTLRWLGESNGYYSESVEFYKHKKGE